MMDKPPRYCFGNVDGAMKNGTAVSIGFDSTDQVTIEFNYTDQQDGQLYHVYARGHRTKINKET